MRTEDADRESLFEQFATDPSPARRNAIVESYIPLAEFFAKRYRNRGVDAEDLRQVAKLGLVKAVDRFDADRGVRFSTFAGRTIDGELKRHFRDKSWAVRVPRSLQEASLSVRAVADDLSVQLGRAPTVREIAEAAKLGEDLVIEALDVQSSYRASSLDAGPSDGSGSALTERLGSVDRRFEETDVRLAVSGLLDTLPARERSILELRFFEELSQAEIAERVGVSQMHVSRLLRRSLTQLRTDLRQA